MSTHRLVDITAIGHSSSDRRRPWSGYRPPGVAAYDPTPNRVRFTLHTTTDGATSCHHPGMCGEDQWVVIPRLFAQQARTVIVAIRLLTSGAQRGLVFFYRISKFNPRKNQEKFCAAIVPESFLRKCYKSVFGVFSSDFDQVGPIRIRKELFP